MALLDGCHARQLFYRDRRPDVVPALLGLPGGRGQ